MIILRQKQYSKKKEETDEKDKKSKKRQKIGAGVAIGSALGGELIGTKYILENELVPGSDDLRENLKLKKKGGSEEDKTLFKKLVNNSKDIKKEGYSPMGPAYNPITDTIMGMNDEEHADILSHELGHRHYFKEKNAGKVGKAAHKLYLKSGGSLINGYVVPNVTGVTAGIISGKRKARKENKGEKESKLNKHIAWAAPIVTSAPMLISEAAASRHGYKNLKKNGASKEYLKQSRKNLATAFGTYATKALVGSGVGAASKEIAYRKEKRKLEKKKKEENKD